MAVAAVVVVAVAMMVAAAVMVVRNKSLKVKEAVLGLYASSYLYKRLCLSISLLVHPLVRLSVRP